MASSGLGRDTAAELMEQGLGVIKKTLESKTAVA